MLFSSYYADTSQIQTVDITSITNGIRYQCYFLLHSLLWGCGIFATKFTNNNLSTAPQNTTTHIASGVLTNLCPGEYNVTILISYNETYINYNHIILKTKETVNGTNCRTMSLFPDPTSMSSSIIPSVCSSKYYISLDN